MHTLVHSSLLVYASRIKLSTNAIFTIAMPSSSRALKNAPIIELHDVFAVFERAIQLRL